VPKIHRTEELTKDYHLIVFLVEISASRGVLPPSSAAQTRAQMEECESIYKLTNDGK
jgi:hypothetical protein